MGDCYDDYRDLADPKNFINRTAEQQKQAVLYFLRAGAIESVHRRVAYMREVRPDFTLDLRNADLSRSCLWQVDLAGADLRNVILDWSNLDEANLAGADLSGASLMGVVLSRADLRGANLSRADLRGVDFDQALLDGAIFDDARMGDIPPEKQCEKKIYREPDHLALPIRKKQDDGTRPAVSGGDLSSHAAMERRRYDTPADGESGKNQEAENKGRISPEEFQKQLAEKHEEKKKEHQKWYRKKKDHEKFLAKKEFEQKKIEERKRLDHEIFLRKKKEQEDFLARKRREEETRRR